MVLCRLQRGLFSEAISCVVNGHVSQDFQVIVSESGGATFLRANGILSLSKSATDSMGFQASYRANLAGLAIIVSGAYICYDATNACLDVRCFYGVRRWIRILFEACSVTANSSSKQAFRVIFDFFCVTFGRFCCVVHVDGVFFCIVASCFSFMVDEGGYFFRRAFTGNDRLQAIFQVRGYDCGIAAGDQAGLVRRIFMDLSFFLVLVIASFG